MKGPLGLPASRLNLLIYGRRMPGFSQSPTDTAPVPTAARLGLVAVVALTLGFLTAYAQEWLPTELGSLANSSASWALAAFGLALFLASGVRTAALIGTLALFALLATCSVRTYVVTRPGRA